MQPNNVTGYVGYFRQLAISHKDLQHDPLTEEGEGEMENKRFAIFGSDEVIAGLRTQLKFPALLIELYETTASYESIYDIRKKTKGSFMVIDNALESNFLDELRAYATAEGIINDILKQIWQDHYGVDKDRCQTPFQDFYFDYEITPTGKLFQNEYGYYVQFNFKLKNDINISEAPANGTFI